MRRTDRINLILGGLGVVVLIVILLATTGTIRLSNPRSILSETATVPEASSVTPTATPTETVVWPPPREPGTGPGSEVGTPQLTATVPAPDLEKLTPPPGGGVIQAIPAADAVGWVSAEDEEGNHFGDYNIYAGVFEGQQHVGALQIDLTQVISPGVPILYADLVLFGLSDEWLADGGRWTLEMLEPWMDADWPGKGYVDLVREDAGLLELPPPLMSEDLGAGQANIWVLEGRALEELAARTFTGQISFRVVGPEAGADNLFSWDSGYGSGSRGWAPVLRLVTGPVPEGPVASPTPRYVVITSTPTPENILTRAALDATATAAATTTGTATPLPANWVTPLVVLPTETPANAATAEWHAAVSTAVAAAYGTPTPLPPNAWTATPALTPAYTVVTNTPTPQNWATAVAQAVAEATRRATAGPPTSFPPYVVTATPAMVVVTSTPTPQNAATVEALRAQATIVALQVGTPTPTPGNWATATPEPTPPLLIPFGQMTATTTPTPTPGPCLPVPAGLRGRIAFLSDRLGKEEVFVMDANGRNVALLTQRAVYDSARACEPYALDGMRRVVVLPGEQRTPQLFLEDRRYGDMTSITNVEGLAYDPAWAPRSERIAFVSTAPGNDEVYTVNADGSDPQRLTWNTWEWDKHPTWSPDGRQIAFYSNRYTGLRQIWVMEADGTDVRNLSGNGYNDWDPVWLK